jgi:integrase
MLGKITKAAVDKLEPGSLLWDTNLSGFGVRRQLRYPHYIVRYRFSGKQKFVTIGKHGAWTPETARREAQRLLGVVASGVDPNAKAADGDNFGAALNRYLERKRLSLRPRSFVEVERHLRKHAQPLHSLQLPAITRRNIAEVLADIESESGMVARNRVRSSLSAFWRWLITEGLIETNPVQGTAQVSEGRGRERVLTQSEIDKVWAALDQDKFSDIVRLLLLTGQRRNEIGALAWDEVDLARGMIVLPAHRTKNKRKHEVPLSAQALAILARLPRRNTTDFLFGKRGFTDWEGGKGRLDERLGIAPWRLHDLRRTCATGMAESGVQPHIIEAVLNHVSGHKAGVAGIYNRARYEAEMRDALQRWADHVEKITHIDD